MRHLALAALVCAAPLSALADTWGLASEGTQFQRVTDKATFVRLVEQGDLGRFGISLKVMPDGRIDGNAFGRDVSGKWEWQDGYFCRDMAWGSTQLGANCQTVSVAGNLVRFQSDRGTGDFADLRLR